MCNPADDMPTVEGEPSDEAVNADTRTTAQRNHDAFTAMTRCALMSGELGSHQGLPVTITIYLRPWSARRNCAYVPKHITVAHWRCV